MNKNVLFCIKLTFCDSFNKPHTGLPIQHQLLR